MGNILQIISLVCELIIFVLIIVLLVKTRNTDSKEVVKEIKNDSKILYDKIKESEDNNIRNANMQFSSLNTSITEQTKNNLETNRNVYNSLNSLANTIDKKMSEMNQANQTKLDEMRKTVDEKLQESLDNRLSKSLQNVTEQLQAMYKSIGEVQSITTSVADLKKVLSNTKQRGILGEIQLKSILEDIMPRQQYEENIATVPNSTERVEFAIKMPSQTGRFVYLPIDSKFPAETYTHLLDAYNEGNKASIEENKKLLIARLKSEAMDIRNKYIHVPDTTDFGIMFLPTEGLYSEACNLGMMELLQREYHVTISGPSSMAALLNSLQTGFRALDVQKRSAEVFETLGAVKSEFGKFEELLNGIQNRLKLTSTDLDNLVGTRTRAINRKLRDVESNTSLTFNGNGDTYEDVVDLLENK